MLRKCLGSALVSFGLVLSFCGAAHAVSGGGGVAVGNGGNVVKCPAAEAVGQAGTTLEVLDVYEGRELFNLNFAQVRGAPGYAKYLDRVAGLLDRLAPEFARRFRSRLASFFQETHISTDIQLRLLDDAYYVQVPQGCELLQIAIQRTPLLPGDDRYFIDQDLFDHLDELNQAALVLHELLYREALDAGQTNSLTTRRLVGLLLSEKMEGVTTARFGQVLSQLGFPAS